MMLKICSIFLLISISILNLKASDYEITVLATNTANFGGIGEWSFSALLESDDEKILFDTGFNENTVLHNANLLGKDLSQVEKVILSHFHGDHTGGLIKLRKTFMEINPKAFSTVYVAEGFFEQRYDQYGELRGFIGGFNKVDNFLMETDKLGIKFIILEEPKEISKNLYLSGPVERIHEKAVVTPGFYLKKDGRLFDDLVHDDQSLGIMTKQGWYMMSGCGHAGMINTCLLYTSPSPRD